MCNCPHSLTDCMTVFMSDFDYRKDMMVRSTRPRCIMTENALCVFSSAPALTHGARSIKDLSGGELLLLLFCGNRMNALLFVALPGSGCRCPCVIQPAERHCGVLCHSPPPMAHLGRRTETQNKHSSVVVTPQSVLVF